MKCIFKITTSQIISFFRFRIKSSNSRILSNQTNSLQNAKKMLKERYEDEAATAATAYKKQKNILEGKIEALELELWVIFPEKLINL